MYHSSLINSSIPASMDNNCMDFGIYGIEQNDCYLDLNCIQPSLIPEEQQPSSYISIDNTIFAYENIVTSNKVNQEMIEPKNQSSNQIARRTVRKKRVKKDPNEPQKPVSAYALFFRDTQAVIKHRSPNASFGEVSKIVASMWDSLDWRTKNLYKQRTEAAKKDYLKKLAAYRVQQISYNETNERIEGERLAIKAMKCSTSSNLKQNKVSHEGQMTLASLIARPSSALLLQHHRFVLKNFLNYFQKNCALQ